MSFKSGDKVKVKLEGGIVAYGEITIVKPERREYKVIPLDGYDDAFNYDYFHENELELMEGE